VEKNEIRRGKRNSTRKSNENTSPTHNLNEYGNSTRKNEIRRGNRTKAPVLRHNLNEYGNSLIKIEIPREKRNSTREGKNAKVLQPKRIWKFVDKNRNSTRAIRLEKAKTLKFYNLNETGIRKKKFLQRKPSLRRCVRPKRTNLRSIRRRTQGKKIPSTKTVSTEMRPSKADKSPIDSSKNSRKKNSFNENRLYGDAPVQSGQISDRFVEELEEKKFLQRKPSLRRCARPKRTNLRWIRRRTLTRSVRTKSNKSRFAEHHTPSPID
jgi:hypothetical protein